MKEYRINKSKFHVYVARVFSKRMKELGLTKRRMLEDFEGKVTRPTLTRILEGGGGTSCNTLATYCGLLGLEIVIRPKQPKKRNEDKD